MNDGLLVRPMPLSELVAKAAASRGVSPGTLLGLAKIESNNNPNAVNPKSGAAGLYQFMPSTARAYGLSDPHNVADSVDAAARLTADNKKFLSDKLGRTPTPGELYLAHQQGAQGAYDLLSNPAAKAVDVLGSKAKVTQNGGNENMSSADFAKMWTNKMDQLAPSVIPKAETPSAPATNNTPSAGNISNTTPMARAPLDIGSYNSPVMPNTLGVSGVNARSFDGSIPGRWDDMNMPMSMNKPTFQASMLDPTDTAFLTPELKALKSGVQLHANPLPTFAAGSAVTPTQGGTITTPTVAPTIDKPIAAVRSSGGGMVASPSGSGGGLLTGNTPNASSSGGSTPLNADATKPTDKKWSDILGSATSGMPKTPMAQAPDLQPANLIPQVDADWQARMAAARQLMSTLISRNVA